MKKQFHQWMVVIGLGVLVALAASGCAAPAPAADNDAREHTIQVSGSGTASGTPDVAYVELGVEVTAGDIDEAISSANNTMASVQAAISETGVADADMRTTNFNVWTEEPRDDTGLPTGQPLYHVSNILRVTVRDISTTGDVIGAGLDAGANAVRNLSFGIQDTAELEAEARREAVENARSRAEQLAEGLDVSIGAPVQISEASGGGPVVERAAADAEMMAAGAAPPISEGELTVSVRVNVSFLIEQ